MLTEQFLEYLDGVVARNGNHMARCPAHEDRTPSLSISEVDDKILLKCQAGCETEIIMKTLGLTMGDLFTDSNGKHSEEVEAVYEYTNAAGAPVFEVVRFAGKRFSQRLPGSEEWGLKGLQNKPLFHLPELLEGIRQGRRVWIVEGEKDVLALQRSGAVATCCVGGAGKWNHNYVHDLRGAKHVRIVADRDEPGLQHAEEIARTLGDIAHETVVAKEGKDAYDHLAAGLTLDDFTIMPQRYGGVALISADTIIPGQVQWIPGWEGFFPFSGLSHVAGMPGVNKSTLTCKLAAEVSKMGHNVLMITSEDSWEYVVVPRLIAAGADLTKVHHPDRYLTFPFNVEGVHENISHHGVRLVIIDPVDAHLDGSVDSHKNQSVRSSLAPLGFVADATRSAIVMVGHPNKGNSKDPMLRVGGSIGIPGISRSAMLMGFHPDHPAESGMRVLASYKSNWMGTPKSKVFRVEMAPAEKDMSIRLTELAPAYITARQLLPRGSTEENKT